MAAYFFDTSALVKRYVREVGTDWIEDITESDESLEIYVVRIIAPEIVAALFRKYRSGDVNQREALGAVQRFMTDLEEQYQVIRVTKELTEIAMSLISRHPLRGYDSVQLAAGIELRTSRISVGAAPFTFVSADARLNEAAQTEGLIVANPNDHP